MSFIIISGTIQLSWETLGRCNPALAVLNCLCGTIGSALIVFVLLIASSVVCVCLSCQYHSVAVL